MQGSEPRTVVPVPLSEVSRGEWAGLMWGFFWRGLVYTIGCAFAGGVVGGIVGGVIGGVMGLSGASTKEITFVTEPIGFVLGIAVAIVGLRVYLGWLLASRFGALRLAVVRGGPPAEVPARRAA